jgi:hypothetical protein
MVQFAFGEIKIQKRSIEFELFLFSHHIKIIKFAILQKLTANCCSRKQKI